MATVTRGYTFGSTEQVTNTKLHTLVDSATVSNIAAADFVSGVGTVTSSTSAPSATDGLWVDTNTTPPTLKIYNGTIWVPADELNILTNKSGISLSPGAVTVISTGTAESVTTTSAQGNVSWRGIALQTVSNNATGVFKAQGYVPAITLETSASAGCFLITSTATGKAVQAASGTAGIFAVVTTAGTASAAGYLFGAASQSSSYIPTAANALAGSVVQTVNVQSGASATGTTSIPDDDTIPEITEGTEFMTLAITPTNASNKLKIEVVFNGGLSATERLYVGLFQDSTAGALAAGMSAVVINQGENIKFTHYMTAGTTSATTFRVRAGGQGATLQFNGLDGSRKLGGIMASSITIQEIKV